MAPDNQQTDNDKPDAAGASGQPSAPGPAARFEDVPQLGYEQARDELIAIVSQLEGGALDLEESMRLWERGEALAEHCSTWLDAATTRLEDRARSDGPSR